MKTLFVNTCLLLLFFTSGRVAASNFETGPAKLIQAPVNGDLYVSNGTITVNARIDGDMVAAGGTISINDSVTGDLLLGGGTLIINGNIGDDIRAAGGTVTIEKNVAGDVIVAGGEVVIGTQANIAGNLILMSGTAIMNGTVKGNAKLMGGKMHLNGRVEKDLEVKGGELFINGVILGKSTLAAEQITIQQQARFHQDVAYWQESGPVQFGKTLVNGKAYFRPEMQLDLDDSAWYFLGFGSLVFLLIYLTSALLLLFLFQYLFSSLLKKAGKNLTQHTLKLSGYGVLYLIGVPALAVFLITTVIGIPIGVMALFFYLFTILLSYIISALVVANWYKHIYRPQWKKQTTVWIAFVAFVFIKLLVLIPVAGWLVSVLIISLSFGSIIESLRKKPVPAMA